ncbi:hypothetical protein GWI33_019872 [Rhynchophorus ferrugineus]|uniref:Uncharacterized protein n=1 Tax=Rhynchophorus ferrugineus TaxID=354439 RepID=A0A834HRV6_RHYFE|nr:hypothetical protein GWI33_019872 [Rhynchophorus ferrugineus]
MEAHLVSQPENFSIRAHIPHHPILPNIRDTASQLVWPTVRNCPFHSALFTPPLSVYLTDVSKHAPSSPPAFVPRSPTNPQRSSNNAVDDRVRKIIFRLAERDPAIMGAPERNLSPEFPEDLLSERTTEPNPLTKPLSILD